MMHGVNMEKKIMHYVTEYNFCVLRISMDFVLRMVESGFSYRDSLVYLVHILVTAQTVSREGAVERKPPLGFQGFLFNVLGLTRDLYNVMSPY